MKVLKVFVLVLILVLALTACAPTVAGLQQLPDEATLLIFTLVTAAATWVLLKVGEALKIDLTGYAAPVAAIVAPILITLIESWLQLIPPVFDDIVLSVIHFLVLLLGSLGAFAIGRKRTKATLLGR